MSEIEDLPHDDWYISEVRIVPRLTEHQKRARAEYRSFMAMAKPRVSARESLYVMARNQSSMGSISAQAGLTNVFGTAYAASYQSCASPLYRIASWI